MKGKDQMVWVWIEHHRGELPKAYRGLLGKAQELCEQLGGGQVGAVSIGADNQEMAQELIEYGCDKVYLADAHGISFFETGLCANFITQLIRKHRPAIVLWSASSLGRGIASRTATKLGTGLTAHCIDLYIDKIDGKNQLVMVVAGWCGNMTLKIICPKMRPQMATVGPGIFSPKERKKRKGEIIPVRILEEASDIEIVDVVEEQEDAASLEQSEVVLVGGWGLNALGGFQSVNELAQILNGSLAGTRPALDAGWIPEERMVGQSGRTVAPKLLITLGVSGAAQFTTGILNSKFILAVDKDPKAPIFEVADIGIVGDLKEVLPLLTEKIRAMKLSR